MRWQGGRESQNVEDRRGQGGGGFRMPGLGGARRGGGIGIGTIVVAMLIAWIFGINPLTLLGIFDGGSPAIEQSPSGPPSQSQPQGLPQSSASPQDRGAQAPGGQGGQSGQSGQSGQGSQSGPTDAGRSFVSVVLASTEDVWNRLFQQSGSRYTPPTLVLFSGATPTACGSGSAAAGPFYCPADRKVYIDLSFYRTMRDRLGAPGDTAQAYVIAHEVGHHIQNLTGTMRKMETARQQVSERQYNDLSIRLELQADCYAGVWANNTQQARKWFDQGDIEEAMNAAAAVGDDNIQRRTQGVVVPESFTHGSSQQRSRWFRAGLQSGSIDQCDTFSARSL